MKKAGDVLSMLFDEQFMKKARDCSQMFDCWAELTEKHGIADAAGYSRVRGLERGILLVEADHPGWVQILQTKSNSILDDYRRRFPDLEISGISLMLSKAGPPPVAGEHGAEGR